MRLTLVLLFIFLQALTPTYSGELNQYSVEYYKGFIDDKYEFLMQIVNNNNVCSGSYYYKKHKKPILLNGACESKNIALEERNNGEHKNNKVGFNKFIGIKNNDNIDGTWQSADGRKTYKFRAAKVVPNKAEILGDAKGEYYLLSISGFYGANSMADIYKEKGMWVASGSSISGGMREGYSFGLSNKEKKILSSFKIVVDEHLAVNITSEEVIIAKFPYSEKSVFRVKNISREEDDINRIYEYAKYDNFYRDRLHIATSDEFSFSNYITFENTPVDPVHAVTVDYYPGGFEVSIIDKQCCGGTSLQFIRR